MYSSRQALNFCSYLWVPSDFANCYWAAHQWRHLCPAVVPVESAEHYAETQTLLGLEVKTFRGTYFKWSPPASSLRAKDFHVLLPIWAKHDTGVLQVPAQSCSVRKIGVSLCYCRWLSKPSFNCTPINIPVLLAMVLWESASYDWLSFKICKNQCDNEVSEASQLDITPSQFAVPICCKFTLTCVWDEVFVTNMQPAAGDVVE